MKKVLVYSAILLSITLVSCTSKSSSSNSTTSDTGSSQIKITSPVPQNDTANNSNTPTNLNITGGAPISSPILKVNNNTYISEWIDNNRLYRYTDSSIASLNDLLKADKKYDLYSSEMVSDSEKVYFINLSDNSSIYSLSALNDETKKLDNSATTNLALGTDGLYFINKSDNYKIYKLSLTDNSKTAITQDASGKFLLFDNWIISQNKSDNYKLYAYSLSDNTKIKLTNNSSESFGISQNKLYYVNSAEQNSIWSVDLQTLEDKKVANVQAENLQVIGDRIFFINNSSANYLSELTGASTGTATVKFLVNEGIAQYHILDNTIYYESVTSNNTIKSAPMN